ncbi:hypothetical protein C8R46DRAFT_1191581 [Mycena filopes]|nr:hypothetical protein C8R46DRAFT_1191581 [Mycena filopes]
MSEWGRPRGVLKEGPRALASGSDKMLTEIRPRFSYPRCLPQPLPTWTEGRYKTLYHGTSVADAQRMLQHGVSLPRQRGQISPGQFSYEGGFYLTDQPQGAAQFAQFKTGQPRVAVLAFRWDRSQMKILEFGQGRNMQGFMPYFIFSLTNWGEDITSVLPAHVFRQQRVGHFQRPMNLRELRRATAATLSMYDMVAGPMLRTGDTEAHVCQYAINFVEVPRRAVAVLNSGMISKAGCHAPLKQ